MNFCADRVLVNRGGQNRARAFKNGHVATDLLPADYRYVTVMLRLVRGVMRERHCTR